MSQTARFQETLRKLAMIDEALVEGRRLFSALLGTFFLVLVAVGGGMPYRRRRCQEPAVFTVGNG